MTQPSSQRNLMLSLLGLTLALVSMLLFWKPEQRVFLGLFQPGYFVVLVLLALVASWCLFGLLRSSKASFKGTWLEGKLELGGPVVLLLLIPVLGMTLPETPTAFDITVFVQRAGPAAQLGQPFTRGTLQLQLESDPREAEISTHGDAVFRRIPPHLRGQTVRVLLRAPGYRLKEESLTLEKQGLTLSVLPEPVVFHGHLVNPAGQPVADAQVLVETHETRSDANGNFSLQVPELNPEDQPTLRVLHPGYQPQQLLVTPGAGEIQLRLEPLRSAGRQRR